MLLKQGLEMKEGFLCLNICRVPYKKGFCQTNWVNKLWVIIRDSNVNHHLSLTGTKYERHLSTA